MIGKIIKVSEIDLTFGKAAPFLEIYSCFKYKKNGNKYLIYKHQDDPTNTLYYGSVYFKPDSLIIIDIKGDIDFIKEFTHCLINKKDLSKYEILDLTNIMKAEIISENKLEVKPETLASLYELTIPKPEVKEEVKPKKKKNKGLIFLIIFLILAIASILLYFYQDKIFGSKKEVICNIQYNHEELTSRVDEEIIYNFSRKGKVEKITKNITYTFNNLVDYSAFKDNNTYYKYTEDNSTYQFDDVNFTYKQFVKIPLKNNNLPEDYEEVISYFEAKKYTCTKDNNHE